MVECIGVFAEFHRSSGRTKPLIAFVQIVEKAFQCIVVEPSKKIRIRIQPFEAILRRQVNRLQKTGGKSDTAKTQDGI